MEVAKKVFEPTLCWDCANATNGEVCPWANDFTPVPGWEAEKTYLMQDSLSPYESYHVKKCPLFCRDARGGGLKKLTPKKHWETNTNASVLDSVDVDILRAYANCGMRVYRAEQVAHYDRRTISQRLTNIRLKTGVDPREFSGLVALIELIGEED